MGKMEIRDVCFSCTGVEGCRSWGWHQEGERVRERAFHTHPDMCALSVSFCMCGFCVSVWGFGFVLFCFLNKEEEMYIFLAMTEDVAQIYFCPRCSIGSFLILKIILILLIRHREPEEGGGTSPVGSL